MGAGRRTRCTPTSTTAQTNGRGWQRRWRRTIAPSTTPRRMGQVVMAVEPPPLGGGGRRSLSQLVYLAAKIHSCSSRIHSVRSEIHSCRAEIHSCRVGKRQEALRREEGARAATVHCARTQMARRPASAHGALPDTPRGACQAARIPRPRNRPPARVATTTARRQRQADVFFHNARGTACDRPNAPKTPSL